MAQRLKRLSIKKEIGGWSPPKTSHFNPTLSSDQRGRRIKKTNGSKQEIAGSSPPKTSHFNPTLSSDQRGKRIQNQTEGTPEQKDHLKTKKSRSRGLAVKAPV